jgi:hypothetical protein
MILPCHADRQLLLLGQLLQLGPLSVSGETKKKKKNFLTILIAKLSIQWTFQRSSAHDFKKVLFGSLMIMPKLKKSSYSNFKSKILAQAVGFVFLYFFFLIVKK